MSAAHTPGHKARLDMTHWIKGKRFYNCFCECGAFLAEAKPRSSCATSFKMHVERAETAKKGGAK